MNNMRGDMTNSPIWAGILVGDVSGLLLLKPQPKQLSSDQSLTREREREREREAMKLVWCPETASKAYMDTVKALTDANLDEADVAELVSAMAGGWKANLIVEAWAPEGGPATGLGLATAARHTRGRHVCVVPDQQSAVEYISTMQQVGEEAEAEAAVVVGEAEEVMRELEGVEMMVVDLRRKDAGRVMREARVGARGMVVVCKSAARRRGGAAVAMVAGTRVVRSAFLPIGSGLEIFHVGVGKGPRPLAGGRWIRRVDCSTGEEHVFRR